MIAATVLLVAVVAVVGTLLMPNQYRAETRVLQPEGGDLGIGGLLQSVAPGAASLLTGQGGGFTRYLAVLNARTMMEEVVEEFDLVDVYELDPTDPATPARAIEELRDRTTFEVSLDFDYLAVRVLDPEPERAAAMANYFVAELNRRHVQLTSQSARQNREFVEARLDLAEAELDSTLGALQAFQEQNGVVELESQVQAFLSSVAEVQARVAEAEIQYQALARQFGESNPQVEAARDVRDAARAEVRRLTGGSESLMPVALADMPALGRTYALLQQELLVQGEILKLVRPLYEQARMEEQRAMDAVQVLDPAIPPAEKATPRRALLCILAVASAFLLASAYVVAAYWLRRHGPHLAARFQADR